jgi:hypothetical protein
MMAVSTSLTPSQQAIVTRLSSGPTPMAELARVCGQPDTPLGRSWVSMQLTRMRRRGFAVYNMRRPGSRRGGLYVLLERPDVPAHNCPRCGARVARDNRRSLYCSVCSGPALGDLDSLDLIIMGLEADVRVSG